MKRADPFSLVIGDRSKLLTVEQIKGLIDKTGSVHGSIRTYSSAKAVRITFDKSMHKYNRFNDEEQGAWYCALEHDTAVKEMRYHCERRQDETRKRGQEGTDGYRKEIIFREIFADFSGTFRDARGEPRDEGILGLDIKTAYPLGQQLAHKLRAEGARGIVYPSVRDSEKKGTCLVAFHKEIVQNPRPGDCWKMSWNKDGEFNIDKMEEDFPVPTD